MKSLIVYGPQGCGKTTHAEELMRNHHLTSVVELDSVPANQSIRKVAEGVLYLTCDQRLAIDHAERFGLRVMSFEHAMRTITVKETGGIVFNGVQPRRVTMHNPAFAAPYGDGTRPKTLDQLFTASGQTLDEVAAEATRRRPGETDVAFRARIQRAVQAADYSKMAEAWDPATGKDRTVSFSLVATREELVNWLLNNLKNYSREYLEEQSIVDLVALAKDARLAPGPWLKLV